MEQRRGSAGPPISHNLPAEVASFIGRDHDRAEVAHLLSTARLLTLTGVGGCGKTRLALRAAADLLPRFRDGVWVVSLAPLAGASLVDRAVATALGVRGSPGRPLLASLAVALTGRQMLLLLDNCEHLLGAAARLAETLLRACPQVRILATSREPLRIAGESVWRIRPLALPTAPSDANPATTTDALAALSRVEAIALFLDRACARVPAFTLTAENAPFVIGICRHLEGLPLGIELAAARLGALDPRQIAARFDDSLRLLAGGSRTLPRHETLRATLDWSYALLVDAERALFRRLAAFAGSFSIVAAEQVCAGAEIDPSSTLELLLSLVEKSLVEPEIHAGTTRYRLLEPVRQYAAERLVASAEGDALRLRHASFFAALAEAAEPALMTGSRASWMATLATELDNLRAALAWSREQTSDEGAALGLRLAGALFWFWGVRGEASEGHEWTEGALARGHAAAPFLRAKALHAAGELAWLMGQTDLARTRLEASATIYRALGDSRGLAYTLQALPMVIDQPHAGHAAAESLRLFEETGDAWGAAHAALTQAMLALVRGDDPTIRGQLEAALARWRELGDAWGMAQALNFLGDLARSQGRDADAAGHYQESLALLRQEGLTGTVPSLLHNLGYLAVRGGRPRHALHLFRESLTHFRDQGDQRGVAECLAGLGGALAALKQPERAARLFGAAEALSAGATLWPANQADYARHVAAARAPLADATFAAAWAAGRALSLEQAIGGALAVDSPESRDGDLSSVAGAASAKLTAREREVAVLVARGLTNRQIGAALVITEGTARLHVKHILGKLDFTSRAQVAAWAVACGLAAAPETPFLGG